MVAATVSSSRKAVVVIGCHRSGTSAMSRVLALSGGALPQLLMAPNVGNPTGYWEPQEVADFNDRVLSSLDIHWRDVFGPRRRGGRALSLDRFKKEAVEIVERNYDSADLIVLKDPRVSLIAEFWANVLAEAGYQPHFVVMVRDPAEIAESLTARDALPRNQSLIMWASYMLAAERGTRSWPRAFVRFQDLLSDPEGALDRMELTLNLSFPRRTWQSAAEIESFLKADVRSRVGQRKSKFEQPLAVLDAFYDYLQAAASDKPENEDVPKQTADWLRDLEQVVAPILSGLSRTLAKAEARASELEQTAEEAAAAGERGRAQVDELESALAERATQAEEAERQRQLSDERVAQLEAAAGRVDELESQLAQVKAEAERLAAALGTANHALEADQARLREASEALASQLELATAREAALQSELAQVSAEAETLGAANQALEADQQRLREASEAHSSQLELANERETALESELALARSEADRLSAELAEAAQTSVDDAERSRQRSEEQAQQLAAANDRARELESELAVASQAHVEDQARWREQADQQADELTIARQRLVALDGLEQELSVEQDAARLLRDELQALKESHARETELLRRESEERTLLLEGSAAQIAKLESDLVADRLSLEAATRHAEQQAEELTIARQRLAALEELEQELGVEREAVKLLRGELDALKGSHASETELLRRQFAERTLRLEDSVAQIVKLESDLVASRLSLEAAARHADQEAERLNATVAERDQALADSSVKLAELADEIRSMRQASDDAERRWRSERLERSAELEVARERHRALEQASLEQGQRHLMQSADASAQISRLNLELSERQRSLAAADGARQEQAERAAAMQRRLDALEFEAAETARRGNLAEASHERELDGYRQQLEFAQERAETFRQRADALQATLDARLARPAAPALVPAALAVAAPTRINGRLRAAPMSPAGWLMRLRRLTARDAVRRGDSARDRRAFLEAASAYAEALQRDPSMAHIWVQYGHMQKEAGDWNASEDAYRRALTLTPEDYDIFLNLGHLLKISGRLPEAKSAYEKAHYLEPSHAGVEAELVEVNRRLGGAASGF